MRIIVAFLAAQAGLCGADFEALSLRRSDGSARNSSMRGGPGTNSPDRLTYSRVTLKSLIEKAYGVERYQVIGPPWLEVERYDLAAKLPPGTKREELQDLLRNALEARFGLAAHRENREIPVYVLSTGKGGPKLTPSTPPDAAATANIADASGGDPSPVVTAGPDGIPVLPKDQPSGMIGMILPGKAAVRAKRQSMAQLAKLLTDLMDRPALDRTSLAGNYDFTLTWAPETRPGQGPLGNVKPPDRPASAGGTTELPAAAEPGLTIFTAIESQLGLTLKATRATVEVLVIDRAEKTPSGN